MTTLATTARNILARRRERWLIVAAALILTIAATTISLTHGIDPTAATYAPIGLFIAVTLIAHIAVGILAPTADQTLMPTAFLLNGLGIAMIHRLDPIAVGNGLTITLAPSQVRLSIIGIIAMIIVLAVVRAHSSLTNYAYLLGLGGLFLLILPVIWPFGHPQGAVNAKIWISIGHFSLQPGEFAKILFIVFFAKLLVDKSTLFAIAGTKHFGVVFPRWRDIAQIVAVWFIAMGVMIVENDFGPVLLLFGTVLVMLYVSTGRIAWIVVGGVLIAAGAPVLYHMSAKIQDRVHNAWNPLAHFDGTGYQPSQALFAWGSGGLSRFGLGSGWPQLVPVAHSDYILTAFGEELGLVGVSAVIVLFAVMFMRGILAAMAAPDGFGTLVAAGLSVTLMIQVFTVVAGTSSLLPMTGLTTPFISAGGSSLIANYALLALLLRISAAGRKSHVSNTSGRRGAAARGAAVPA